MDTPPILLCPEAITLSTKVDGTILVSRGWATKIRAVREAVKSLGRANLVGIVLNDGTSQARGLEYYGYYGNTMNKL